MTFTTADVASDLIKKPNTHILVCVDGRTMRSLVIDSIAMHLALKARITRGDDRLTIGTSSVLVVDIRKFTRVKDYMFNVVYNLTACD